LNIKNTEATSKGITDNQITTAVKGLDLMILFPINECKWSLSGEVELSFYKIFFCKWRIKLPRWDKLIQLPGTKEKFLDVY